MAPLSVRSQLMRASKRSIAVFKLGERQSILRLVGGVGAPERDRVCAGSGVLMAYN